MNSLLTKLSSITEELGALSKSGTNSKFNYSYVKGEDAMKDFRTLEVKHKIKVFPIMRDGSLTITQKESGLVTTFVVDYVIADLESDQTYRVTIPVQGYDSTDKGVFKALTGGFKYFLLQTFSFSSDDPEKEDTDTEVKSFRKGVAAVSKAEIKDSLPSMMENSDKDILTTVGANTGTNGVSISKSRFNTPKIEVVNTSNGATPSVTTPTVSTDKVRFSKSGFTSFNKTENS